MLKETTLSICLSEWMNHIEDYVVLLDLTSYFKYATTKIK